jgi:NADPH-dependent 2,4-dienoyl-CoA reductase/sulfur reductase-like enzyme
MVGFHATGGYEPRQVRKEAAVSGIFGVPWSCLAGASWQKQLLDLRVESRCTAYRIHEGVSMSIKKVCVIGSGTMGGGIAQVSAHAGYETIMVDTKQEFVDRGMKMIRTSLARFVEKEKMTQGGHGCLTGTAANLGRHQRGCQGCRLSP